MNETELNAIFDIVTDPVKNVYMTNSIKSRQEIERIMRIFDIVKKQKKSCAEISARALVAFRLLVSNN